MSNVRVIPVAESKKTWICKICESSGVGGSHAYTRHYLDFHSYDLEKERRR
jgi:hypothetical protein